jgi:hypothetical protein
MINVNVELKNDIETEFLELQKKLGFENKTEVLRWAIKFTNKRYTV